MAKKPANKFSLLIFGSLILFVLSGAFIYKSFFQEPPCANPLSCEESLEFSVDNDETAVFAGVNIDPPDIDLTSLIEKPTVLGSQKESGEKRIEVDLSTQTLKAYEGDELFMKATISSGKLYPTPTGEFTIWRKIRSTKMSGGEGAGYYYLPNVPYVMFYSNDKVAAYRGFSLHGTYWHNNFGHPMSHGCVNMKTREAKKLFEWADPPTAENARSSKPGELGTKIIVYGKAP